MTKCKLSPASRGHWKQRAHADWIDHWQSPGGLQNRRSPSHPELAHPLSELLIATQLPVDDSSAQPPDFTSIIASKQELGMHKLAMERKSDYNYFKVGVRSSRRFQLPVS